MAKTEVKPKPHPWGSQEREDRAHARFAEFCNDLAAAANAVGDLETALALARRAIQKIGIAITPAATEEHFVWAFLPYDSGDKLKEADKWLRRHAQQLEIAAMTRKELSFPIFEAIAEIQNHDGNWEQTDLKGI